MVELKESEILLPVMVCSMKETYRCGEYTIFWHPINDFWLLYRDNERIDQDVFISDLCKRNGFRLG